MTPQLFDHMRGAVLAIGSAIGVDRSIHLLAQSVPSLSDAQLMQLAEKGGGWIVLLIVLFFYRRDYQRLTTSENEVRKELLAAIGRQADSEQKLAIAISQNTEMVRSEMVARRHGDDYQEGRG